MLLRWRSAASERGALLEQRYGGRKDSGCTHLCVVVYELWSLVSASHLALYLITCLSGNTSRGCRSCELVNDSERVNEPAAAAHPVRD